MPATSTGARSGVAWIDGCSVEDKLQHDVKSTTEWVKPVKGETARCRCEESIHICEMSKSMSCLSR